MQMPTGSYVYKMIPHANCDGDIRMDSKRTEERYGDNEAEAPNPHRSFLLIDAEKINAMLMRYAHNIDPSSPHNQAVMAVHEALLVS